EFPQLFPGPGHVEHDPEAIWDSQLAVAKEALAEAGLAGAGVLATRTTNPGETTVLWNRASGRPVTNAIVWQSRVSAGICDALKAAGHAPTFRKKAGLALA